MKTTERDDDVVDVDASLDAGAVLFLPVREERTETKLFGKLSWQASGAHLFQDLFANATYTRLRDLDSSALSAQWEHCAEWWGGGRRAHPGGGPGAGALRLQQGGS